MTRPMSVLRQFHPLFALAALVLVAAPYTQAVAAEPQAERQAVDVAYGDLNLNSNKGAKVMLRRIERAANVACGVDPYRRGFADHGQRRCRTAAVEHAVTRLHSPAVTAAYNAREGGRSIYAAR